MANGHRYIQKIVKNGKTRYFYTMEELAAYRKALSSRDEENKLLEATNTKNHKNWTDGKPASRRTKLANAQLRAYNSEDKKKTAALKDWQEATTIKGKAKAVKETFDKYNPETAKKIEKGKKKMSDYKKALSSKDEMVALKKATGTKNTHLAYIRGLDANRNKRNSEASAKKALKDNDEREYIRNKAYVKEYDKRAKAYKKYDNAKSLSGKAKAVSEVYKKYHPKKKKSK